MDTPWHEFREDVEDYSMCRCGVPALTHDRVFPDPVGKGPRLLPTPEDRGHFYFEAE